MASGFQNPAEVVKINGMGLEFDPQKVWLNVRKASTEDLLDRITVYRDGMEPEAVPIIEEELRRRGVAPEDIERHAQKYYEENLHCSQGFPRQCSFCRRPAVAKGWGWHRLWKLFPVFPRIFWYCREHRPEGMDPTLAPELRDSPRDRPTIPRP